MNGQPYRRMAGQRLADALNRIPDYAVDEVRKRLAQRVDPVARLDRQYRGAVEWSWIWLALFLIFTAVAVYGFLPAGPAIAAFTGTVAAALSGCVLGSRVMRVRELGAQRKAIAAGTPPPPPSALASALRLPPKSSQARQPMQRLAESERTLHDLLGQLDPGHGVSPVPPDAVRHARGVAEDTANALRKLAGKVVAVERAKQAAPALERGPLVDAVRELRTRLDDGVDDYGRLVAAAGRAVAASASPSTLNRADGSTPRAGLPGSGHLASREPSKIAPRAAHTEELTEATDRLHGLAIALNELAGNS
ncbi:MAG: hypothetical protein J2O49_04085 [Sciscionella sp.]|nr:hypothetical protein [Sciscionella sp.]